MKISHFLFKDDFIKKSALFTLAAGAISFFNYIYHPILGNLLPVASFGEVEVLYSMYNIFGIFLFAFSSVIIHVTANTENEEERNTVLGTIARIALIVSVGASVVVAATSPLLERVFKFESPLPFIVLALLLPFATYVFFGAATFQGKKEVRPYAMGNGLVSLFRLIFGAILVVVGFKVLGVMFAFLAAQMLAALYVFSLLRKKVSVLHAKQTTEEEKARLKKEVRYGVMVFVANLSVILFSNGDILTVKYFFSPDVAGLYSGISTIGNIIYFAMTPVSAVLLASVKLKSTVSENKRILLITLGITTVFGGLCWLLFATSHGIIIPLALGKKFTSFSPYLSQVALVMALAGVYNVTLMFFLALRKKFVFFPAIFSAALLFVLIALRHQNIDQIIHNFMAAVIVALAVSGARLAFEFLKHAELPDGKS